MSMDWEKLEQDNNPIFDNSLKVISSGLENPLESGIKVSSTLSLPFPEEETLNWVLQSAELLQKSAQLVPSKSELLLTPTENYPLAGELDSLTSKKLAFPIVDADSNEAIYPINNSDNQANPIKTIAGEQLFFLNLKGVTDLIYQGEVTIKGVDSNAFQAPSHLQGQETAIVASLLESLKRIYHQFNVVFTTAPPPLGSEYSTIYLGGNGAAFSQYGAYLGLAEKVDKGNQDKSDVAFVFTENLPVSARNASEYGGMLAEYVAHEAGHLLGFEHEHTVHDATDPLGEVAFKPYTHVEIAKDVREDLLSDGMLTIAGQNYPVHPKILQAIRDYPDDYFAGTVGPDSFPDILMGQAIIHPEATGTWLTRILDMAWQAQNDSSFTQAEKSQILAWSYGVLTHAAGDYWSHTLVNEFAEGVFPAFENLVGNTRDLANAVRHFLVEGYIEDATNGFDNNKDRTVLPDGDVSDNSTPGIPFAAPTRFIYETLIRPVPFDPTSPADTKATSISVNAVERKFIRTDGGSFLADKFAEGQRFTASGFNANNGDYQVVRVTATELEVERSLQAGDALGSGNEQLVVQGKRGLAIDNFLKLRNKLETTAKLRGSRLELGPVAADIIDKLVTGTSIPNSSLENLYTAYLYNWIDNIDQGLRHWPEFGLAFTKAFFDAQSRRDLQNKEGAASGKDTIGNILRGNKENDVGVLDVMLEELDDPNGDGSTKDSFINNNLLPMFGLPREFGMLRTVLQTFGTALNEVIEPLKLAINPILVGIAELKEFAKNLLKEQIKERFGFDFEVFDFLTDTNSKMDLASIKIGNTVIPVFKPGDRQKLDAYLGITDPDAHNPLPSGSDSLPGVTFYPGATGALKDNISFSKTGFAAYGNSVNLSKLLLLQEEPIDGETTAANGLSQLFSNILTAQNAGTPVSYDVSLLNLNGHHGGNILTTTLPGIDDTKPWLKSIDQDHTWRDDSLTTTTALFQVNKQSNGSDTAIWTTNVTPGDYNVQATWLANVTQTVDNPERNLSPATEAIYKIYDGSNVVGTVTKNQRLFSTDAEDSGLSFTNLGQFTVNSGTLRVELLTSGNGDEIAGPVRIVSVANNTAQRIQLVRDPQTLAITPSGYSQTGTGWVDLKYDTGTGNFPLWESEILRPVYRGLFTDWENNGLQFPALGDTTSADPNKGGSTAKALPTHATAFGANLPDNENSIPIPGSVKTLILNGLDNLVAFVDRLDDKSPFTVTLPIVNKTLAEILNLPGQISQTLRDPITNYFETDNTPTFAELFEVVGDKVAGRINSLSSILEFDLDIPKIISLSNLPINLDKLGNANNVLGTNLDLNTNVDFSAILKLVDPENNDLPKFTVGIDLSNNNLSTTDRVFIKADHAIIDVNVAANNLNVDVNWENFLKASIVNGQVNLKGNITLGDSNKDGRLSFSELATGSLSLNSSGTLDVRLPINVNNIFKKEVLTIKINDGNIFDDSPPTISQENSFKDELNTARKNNLDNLELIIQEVGNGIQGIAKNLNPKTGIPFLDQGIENLVEFSNMLSDLSKNLAENSIIGTKEIDENQVKLSEDAIFSLKLNSNNITIGIGIKKEDTQNNTNLADLVADVNSALQRAGLGGVIEAITRNKKIVLRTINLGDTFTLTNPSSVAQNFLGFTAGDSSFKLLALKDIATLEKLDGNKVVLKIDLNKTLQKPINLDFKDSIKTGIGDLKFIGKVDGSFTAQVNLDLELVIDLSLAGSNFDLIETTLLSTFNGGKGISNATGDDIKITLKDGTEATVNFDGDLTVGNAINSIKGILGDKITVQIDNNNKSLNLVDNTIGDGQFSVTAINNSLAGWGLGILGFDFDGSLRGINVGEELDPNGTLISALNSQSGIRINVNQSDLKVSLRDGSIVEIDFTGNNQTVESIFNAIQTATNNKVIASISTDGKGLNLTDNSQGNRLFVIEPVNGSLAGYDLGILGSSSTQIIQGISIGDGITNSTLLSSLNAQSGVRINDNLVSWQINLRDGTSHQIQLPVTKESKLQNIIDAIKNGTSNKVNVIVDKTTKRIHLLDQSNGNQLFKVTANNSNGIILGNDLGILVSSTLGVIQGKTLSANAVTLPLNLTLDTNILSLNTGKGIRINQIENKPDLHINFRDGNSLDINLVTTETTKLGNLIEQINLAANGKVIIEINQQGNGLIVRDNTVGNSQFTITDTEGSFAATDLGINGIIPSTSGMIAGNLINKILDESTTLLIINEINHQSQNKFSDIAFSLRDGSHFEVDLKNSNASIQQIFNEIQEASKDNNGKERVLVNLSESRTGLIITDTTTGTNQFKIEAINNSLAGYDLGILNLESDGRIEGTPIHGDSLSKHISLSKDSQISVNAKVTSQDIDLSAALGFAKLGVNNGTANFGFTATGKLNSDKDIPLLDLFGDFSLLNVNHTAAGNINLPITIQGLELFNLQTPTNPELNIKFTSTPSNPFDYTVTLPNLDQITEQLRAIGNLSTDDILGLVQKTISLLADNNLSIFNKNIPLINKSLNDLLEFLQPIQNAYDKFTGDLKNIKSTLLADIKDLESKVFEPALSVELTPNVLKKSENTFNILETAIKEIPLNLGELNKEIPQDLINAVIAFKEVVSQLPNAAIADLTNDLQTAVDSLPTIIDQQAKEKLQLIIKQIKDDPDSVETHFNNLKVAVINLVNSVEPTLSLSIGNLITVLNQLELAAVTSTKDIPNLLVTLNTAITNLPNIALLNKEPLKSASAKITLAINEVNFTLLTEGLNDLTLAISNLPTPELGAILNKFETILGKLSGNIVTKAFNTIQDIIPSSSNLGKLLFSLFDLELPAFNSEIQQVSTQLSDIINQIPNEFNPLKVHLSQIKTTILKAITEIDPVLLSKAFADLAKEIEQLPTNLDDTYRELLKSLLNQFNGYLPEKLTLAFNNDGDLIFGLDWEISQTRDIPLDFGLQNGNQRIPIDFKTAGKINTEVGVDISLDFGLERLNQVDPSPKLYLLPSTELNLNAKFDVSNFKAGVRIGGISAINLGTEENKGMFSLKNGNDPAQFKVKFTEPLGTPQDGKILLGEIADSIKITPPQGQINLALPVTLLGTPLGSITANSDLSNLDGFTIQVPEDILNKLKEAILNYDIFTGGIDAFLDKLQAVLESEFLKKVPFVGDNIDFANSFIANLRTTFINQLKPILDNPQGAVASSIQQVIWENLGSSGLNIIRDNNNDNLLTIADVIVTFTRNKELKIDLHLGGVSQITSDFNLGLDLEEVGLELDAKGAVNIGLDYDFRFIVGINQTEGFFFELSEGKDFTFNFDIALSDNASVKGKLSFLEVEANNKTLNEALTGKDYNKDGDKKDIFKTEIGGKFTLDITPQNPDKNDNKITVDELSQVKFNSELEARANVALGLTLSLGSRDLPSIKTDLFVDTPITLNSKLGSSAETIISLNDISLNLGDFIRDTIGSVLKNADTYLEPLRPVLDFLTREVPIISDLMKSIGLGKFTVLDAIALYDSSDSVRKAKRVIEIVAAIDDLLETVKNFDGGLTLNYGDYTVIPRPLNGSSTTSQNLLLPNESLANNTLAQTNAFTLPAIIGNLQSKLGIQFPIFDPNQGLGNIISLILGKPADLITWDLPKLDDIGFDQRYFIGPIFPPFPIYATIAARLNLSANLSIGLDTRGLRETGKFLDGFYFDDHLDKKRDNPELTLTGAFAVGAAVNIQVAAIGVEGGLKVDFFADWNDPNKDGKVYFDEVLSNARRNWLKVFDFGGELGAFFDAYVLIGFDTKTGKFITIYEKRIPLFYAPLYQFGTAAESDPPQSPAEKNNLPSTLAHYSTGEGEDTGIEKGTLIIHTGRFAHLRQVGASQDTAEQVYINRLKSGALEVHSGFRTDYRQRSTDPHPTGTIQVLGDDQNEPIVTKIYIDAGKGNDYIEIDDLVTVDLTIFGGSGDDTIKSGLNTTSYIEGGTGNDFITAGIHNDTIIGGVADPSITEPDGKDNITGKGGKDLIFGDNGRIIRNSEEKIIRIESINPEKGDDDVIIVAEGDDTVIGGAGDDFISGTPNNQGNDILLGDSGIIEVDAQKIVLITSIDAPNGGNDTIVAGVGNDTVIGGAANDLITNDGDNSDDILYGDQGYWSLGTIKSLSAASDGNDTLYGEAGNDTIIAGGGSDYLEGVAGEDILFGDHGRIDLEGGIILRIESTDFANGGNDTIVAGVDKDTVIGGARNDLVTNDADSSEDLIYGDQGYWDAVIISSATDPNDGDDILSSEGANDTILGGGAKDYITSGNGLDIILGDHGIVTRNQGVVIRIETSESDSGDNDTIFAGNDDDTVFGGPKNDRITGDTNNNGDDILVGDQGYWNLTEIVSQFDVTSNPDGNDTIFGNGGNDTILGSDGKDYIEGNQGLDIALGDYGIINHTEKIARRINTIEVEKGNDDYLNGGENNDTLIGGTNNDSLFGGLDTGEDILLGDNGTVVNDDGSPESNDIFSHSPLYGGLDRIAGGGGNDTIIGGSGGKDQTDPKATVLTGKSGDGIDGNEGDDIAIGDNAYITRNPGKKNEKIETTFTNYGGDDYILGSAGNDSLIAGYGKDSVSGNDGNEIIFGDNAIFDYLVDSNPDTLDLVISIDAALGDKDTLTGDQGNDLIFGGTKEDSILGGLGNDLIFGDHGKVQGTINLSALPLNQVTPPFTFTAIATQQSDLGGNDTIRGEGGQDIILGQQGNDRLFGDDGDDDIIGGHNVAAGYDGSDEIDGGVGNDAIAGDNATIQRRSDTRSPRWRTLNGQVIYDLNGNPQITADSQPSPTGVIGRNIQLFDQSTTPQAATYGKDTIAGGANDDLIFGQLGDDIIQGDSSTTKIVSLTLPSVEGVNDGDDYIEGGGGKDLIFGNLGQDDIIGGSSNLFGTNLADNCPDAEDTIFGGAGTKVSYNDAGDTSAEGHARDADTILGDNGNIYRLVNSIGQYLSFNYDNYSNRLRLIPRAFQLLDYTPGSNSNNLGGDDLIHGEGGDDEIHGMTGNDIIFGEGQDDNVYGGSGHDRLYGGTGEDGIIGDDGQIFTSRNGQTEPLYGITTANTESLVNIANSLIGAYVNLTNRLKKEARLLASNSGGNDVIYGGLGDDFLHGGAGDDAISGAEALTSFYNSNPVNKFNPLGYNVNTGKFAAYDANNPRQKINNFLLNFEATNAQGNKINDGKDSIFGDLGNDWLVGGTQSDRLFGGAGDDLLNADDNYDTNNGLNNRPDAPQFADGDFAFGGSGLDVLIANTGKDRLIDWFNDCNTYVVPFESFNLPTVTLTPSPEITQFLLKLSQASGADQTLTEPDGEIGLSVGDNPNCTPRDPRGTIPGVVVDSLGGIEDDRIAKV